MFNLASRLNFIPDSAISEMTRLAEEYRAINLASGYPDFDPPAALVEAAHRALNEGYHQYSSTWGSPRFRQALANKQRRFMGVELDPEACITVTCGGTEAIIVALLSVCNPGDRVIVFSPFYENYAVGLLLAQAVPVYVPLHPPEFTFDPQELGHAFQSGVKALVLCNPSNPSGRVFTRAELEHVGTLAQEFDTILITDEVYEHIVYAPHRHTYISSLPGLFERTIACSSLSKTYSLTGWRLGYAIAAPRLSAGLRKLHDYLTICAPAPLQEAAVTGLNFPDDYYQRLQAEYTERRNILLSYLEQVGLRYITPQGAHFVMVDISPLGFEDDLEFCRWMVREIGVAAVPGSSFFHLPMNGLIRLSFARRKETLVEVGERLQRLKDKG